MFSSIQEAWGENFDPKPLFSNNEEKKIEVKEDFHVNMCPTCKKNIENFISIDNSIPIDNLEFKNVFLFGVLIIIILHLLNKN